MVLSRLTSVGQPLEATQAMRIRADRRGLAMRAFSSGIGRSARVGDPLCRLATEDYNVVMPVVSIRFSDEPLHRRLKASAQRHNVGVSTLAERLIDEGLRMEAHPLVVFRDGPAGRRPVLAGGPEVADAIGTIVGGDVPAAERRSRAADLLGISAALVDAAVAYYADYTEEINELIAERTRVADEAQASWHRQRELLEK